MSFEAFTTKVSKFFKRLYAFLPTPLPTGAQDFNTWASSVLTLYNFPDNDSTRGALAIMITQLKPTDAWKSKRHFGLSVHTAAAKEIAGNFYYEMKTKYQALAKAEQEKAAAAKQAEATVQTQPGASNVVPIKG